MLHLPMTEVTRRLARDVACTQCYQRPPGSATLGPEVARSCESSCPLFTHLPALVSLAAVVGERPGDCERAITDTVCSACRLRPTAGEFCAEYASRACPLSRYSGQVVAAVQQLLAAGAKAGATP